MNTKTTVAQCALALVAGLGLSTAAIAAPPTASQVGDADSFGNRVVWLGLVATGNVALAANCTPNPGNPLGPDDRCVTLNAGGLPTNFAFTDLGRITLPGGSTESLLCHWSTPTISYAFNNPTAGLVQAQFRAAATYRIESDVLKDASLINPYTGAPFDGYIDVTVSGAAAGQTLFAGQQLSQRVLASRNCIGGTLSRAQLLQEYKLSEALVKKIFKSPMTIRAGVRGSATWVSNGNVNFSTRFSGDEK